MKFLLPSYLLSFLPSVLPSFLPRCPSLTGHGCAELWSPTVSGLWSGCGQAEDLLEWLSGLLT